MSNPNVLAISQQVDKAEYNEKENKVALPAITEWRRGDFGQKKK